LDVCNKVRFEQNLFYILRTLNITIPVTLNPFILCQSSALQSEEISRHAWLQEDAQAIDTLIAPPI
jgi:hypothetical protein